ALPRPRCRCFVGASRGRPQPVRDRRCKHDVWLKRVEPRSARERHRLAAYVRVVRRGTATESPMMTRRTWLETTNVRHIVLHLMGFPTASLMCCVSKSVLVSMLDN